MSKNGNLRCRIEKKYEEDFKKLAGGKPSELLYELVIKHLKKNNVEINSESGGEVELKFNPILNCRLRQNELVKVNEVLQAESKKPSEFLLGLVRARINKSPHFSKDELNELRQSNKQLVAIGRNLNQLTIMANQGAITVSPMTEQYVENLKIRVKAQSKSILALISKNMKRDVI